MVWQARHLCLHDDNFMNKTHTPKKKYFLYVLPSFFFIIKFKRKFNVSEMKNSYIRCGHLFWLILEMWLFVVKYNTLCKRCGTYVLKVVVYVYLMFIEVEQLHKGRWKRISEYLIVAGSVRLIHFFERTFNIFLQNDWNIDRNKYFVKKKPLFKKNSLNYKVKIEKLIPSYQKVKVKIYIKYISLPILRKSEILISCYSERNICILYFLEIPGKLAGKQIFPLTFLLIIFFFQNFKFVIILEFKVF